MIIKLAISLGVTLVGLFALFIAMIALVRHVAVAGELILGALLIMVFLSVWSAIYDVLYDDKPDKRHRF